MSLNPPCVVHLLDEGVVLLPESHDGTIRYLLPDFKVSPILRFEKGKFYSRNRNIFRKSEIFDKWKFLLCFLILILYTTNYLYIQSTTVYVPSAELGLPQPLSRKRVCPPPPRIKGWGILSRGWGCLGESQFQRHWKKGLALCLLCATYGSFT